MPPSFQQIVGATVVVEVALGVAVEQVARTTQSPRRCARLVRLPVAQRRRVATYPERADLTHLGIAAPLAAIVAYDASAVPGTSRPSEPGRTSTGRLLM